MMFARMAVALAAVIGVPAVAIAADDVSDRVLAPFAACRSIVDGQQRAACFDRAYDGIRARLASGDVTISDAADRQAGFGLPKLPPRQSASRKSTAPIPVGLNEIDSTIVATRPYGVDMFAFQLADGGVWRTADGGPDPQFAPGTKVHLKRVLLGGILLQADRGRQLKVIRVR